MIPLYRVVLVDDDKLVTKFMDQMIPWTTNGFEVVASFHDSNHAYDYLVDNPYDVLITDIGMPRMNGIELLTKLKEEVKLKHNIILSCHDDFQYAQQALKLDTFDYILKESMEEKHIIELLKRLKKQMDETSKSKKYEQKISKFLKENNMTLKSKFLEKIIYEPALQQDEWWNEQEELLDMDFSIERYTVALCYIDCFSEVLKRYETETLLRFSVNNVLEEVLQKYGQNIQIFYLDHKFLLLFPSNHINQHQVQAVLENILREIQSKLNSFLKISLTSFIDKVCQEREALIDSIQKLLNDEDQRFYFSNGTTQHFQLIPFHETSIFQTYVDDFQTLKTNIMNKESKKVDAFIHFKLQKFKEERLSPKTVRDWAMKLMLDVKLSLNALSYFEDDRFNSITSKKIQVVENSEELERTLKEIYHQFMQQVNTIEASTQNEDIVKTQKYVREHLHEKISLKDISEYLHLNPSYFSRLFKKEKGESFIEYVTRMKMEKAMDYLDNTTMSVEKIAIELGFDSKSYFLKTFKKRLGMSPKTYKFKKEEDNVEIKSN